MSARRLSRRRALALPLAGLALSPGTVAARQGRSRGKGAGAGVIIDSHVHLWTQDPQFPFVVRPGVAPPDNDAGPDKLLALMKASGVARALVVQVSHHGWDHRFLLHSLRRYHRQLAGVVRVNPEDPGAPEELARLVQAGGTRAIRGLRLNVQPDPAFDFVRGPLMPPLWQRCRQLGLVMAVQTKWSRLPDIAPLIEGTPGLTVVIDHMADTPVDRPAALDGLLALARFPDVAVKVSHLGWLAKQPYPFPDAIQMVKRLYDRFGPARLLWGSDWPICEKQSSYAETLALVRDHMPFLSPVDRRAILGDNTARLFRL